MRSQESRVPGSVLQGVGDHAGDDCPTIAGLLLAHEGELPRKALARVQAHLRRCAVCRSEVDRVDAIAEAYHARSLARRPQAVTDRSGRRVAEFRDRLQAERREDMRRSLRVPSRRWIPVAALIPLCILGILLSRTYTSVVHADELLARAVAQERNLPQGTMQRLQFELRPPRRVDGRRPLSFVRDVAWSDAATVLAADGGPAITAGRTRGGVQTEAETSAEALVTEYLTRHHFDARRPLSVARFQAWRASLANRTDTITAAGPTLVTLKTTTPDGELREATLTVRRSDFHAVRQALTFEGLGRLEIEEISKWVAPVTKTVELPAPAASAGVVAAALVPDADALDQAELDARLVLHELREDLTSDLRVVRTPRHVLVEGAVSSAPQRRRLSARLGALPHVQASLRTASTDHRAAPEPLPSTPFTPAPFTSSAPLPASPASTPMAPSATSTPQATGESVEAPFVLSPVVPATVGAAGSGVVPGAGFARWLARTFGTAAAGERYLPGLLQMLGAVRLRLTAMQGLADRYPDGAAELSAPARAKLQRLMEAHDRELRGDLEQIDSRLSLLLGTATRPAWLAGNGEPTRAQAAAWQQRVSAGIPYADALQRLVQQLPREQDDLPLPPEIQHGDALEPPVLSELRRTLDELWSVLGSTPAA